MRNTLPNSLQLRHAITLLGAFISTIVCQANAGEMPIISATRLQCEGIETPRAIEKTQPNFRWICESSDPAVRAQVQTAYQILVADSPDALTKDQGNLWDSGKVKSDQSTVTYAGQPLAAHQEVYWKVRLWNHDDAVSPWSQPAYWSMGFLPSAPWQPTWIGSDGRTDLFRKEFIVKNSLKRAWVYASALGLYELRLNGSKVGSDLFTPGWTDYRARVQYQRYDVTDLAQQGGNVIGAEIAPGWFAGRIGWFAKNMYGKSPSFAVQVHLEFSDGTQQVIDTDSSWKTSSGPLTESDIQDGDRYDARMEKPGWDQPGYDDSGWSAVTVREGEDRRMVAQSDQPVGVIRELKPVKVTESTAGVHVYDLGQNITGVVRIKTQGSKGTTITLRHAERLNDDGTLDVTNLKLAQATDTYIMSGNGKETFQPRFTFHGFRWFSVEGLEKAPALTDVTGVVVGTRLPEGGSLQTSNADLNHLLSNIRWTISNSYLSIPMDSPQRSERLGWTGDANVMAATSSWFFDVSRFYAKWQTDILDAQATNDGGADEGLMPNVAPKWRQAGGAGGGWGDVGVNLPYLLWNRYGDTEVIRKSYPGMKKWLTYLESRSEHHIIPTKARVSRAGDWENADDDTPKDLVGTFYYALDVAQMAEMATAIGEDADAAAYREQLQGIRAAIISKYFAEDGQVATGSQTAQVFALHLGLYPDGMRERVLDKLLENIKAHNDHLTTGYLGTQWLLKVLADNGRSDVAYRILLQKTGPSWLYMASNGQTSLWEAWDSLKPDGTFGSKRTSLGHSALGSCGDWMFQHIGGIVPDPARPGFRHFIVRPIPGDSLDHAEMEFQSPHGLIATRWALSHDKLTLELTVPVNTSATVILPTGDASSVTESHRPVASADRVVSEGVTEDGACFLVGSGNYIFTAPVKQCAQEEKER
jgi:alpha-L-rhamnosidase